MKTIVFVLCVCASCLVVFSGVVRNGYPEYEYFPELQGWLKLHAELVDYITAKANCHSEDALLAGPWNNKFKAQLLKLKSIKYPAFPFMYSGAALNTSSPGIPLEPCDNERCNAFLLNGTLSKVHCKFKLPYVCFASETYCADPQYQFNNESGHCYRYHSEAKIEPDARSICEDDDGYLAIINSEAEHHYLQTFVLYDDNVYIDNDGGTGQRHLRRLGNYEDYVCTETHPFICEKDADKILDYLID